MSPKRLVLLLALIGCVRKTETTTVSLEPDWFFPVESVSTDSAVLAQISRAYPCPSSVPAAWVVGDSTLGSGVRCSLVAAGVAAIQHHQSVPELLPILRATDVSGFACVALRAEAMRSQKGKLDLARWSVSFFSKKTPSLVVDISRVTGEARVYRMVEEPADPMPLCRFLATHKR